MAREVLDFHYTQWIFIQQIFVQLGSTAICWYYSDVNSPSTFPTDHAQWIKQ